VVLAAGIGSRFGGLKQLTPVDGAGQRIIDYSVYDALRAGFGSIVFVVKPEMEQGFHEEVGRRMARFADVRYAHQRLDALPEGFSVPEGREKPWGTAHAMLCAAPFVDGPFATINADDFYGRGAFEQAAAFLRGGGAGSHALVGYRLSNTLSEYGAVARGVCDVGPDGMLAGITERTRVEPAPGGAVCLGERGEALPLAGDAVVSMNLWAFGQEAMEEARARFPLFLTEALARDPLRAEYFLPSIPDALIRERGAAVRVLVTDEKWHGMTYREDLPAVRAAIRALADAGAYPERLWGPR